MIFKQILHYGPTVQWTNRPTDQQTDGPTDIPSYRDVIAASKEESPIRKSKYQLNMQKFELFVKM